ncbi:unnamed protein product [Ectocarpus sp. 8 AP-2014]
MSTNQLRTGKVVRDAVVKLAKGYEGPIKRYAPQALIHALEGQPLNTVSGLGTLDNSEEQIMYKAIQDLAREEVTCMSLKQLYVNGKNPEPAHRLANAQFLHRELPVRLSQRAVELMNLPHGLSDVPGVQQVYNCYARYAWELFCAPLPTTPQEEYDYSCLLSSLLLDGQSIPRALSIGLQDFHKQDGGGLGGGGGGRGSRSSDADVDPAVRLDIQEAISRFYTGRIGVRFLIEHHVSTLPPSRCRQGWSGIIQSAVSPSLEAKYTAAAVRSLCMRHLGAAPEVRIFGKDDATFTYVPSHLEVMLSEQLKNACRAVVQKHHPAYKSMTALAGPMSDWGKKECSTVREQALAAQSWSDGGPQMPPIKVTVAMGKADVTMKIADEGGGASRTEMEQLWTYYYTTANKFLVGNANLPDMLTGSPEETSTANTGAVQGSAGEVEHPLPPLAGFGMGLPLSRVYARYFGGDVLLKSMEGFGMDSYLHLNRLGHNCEELPPLARNSCV